MQVDMMAKLGVRINIRGEFETQVFGQGADWSIPLTGNPAGDYDVCKEENQALTAEGKRKNPQGLVTDGKKEPQGKAVANQVGNEEVARRDHRSHKGPAKAAQRLKGGEQHHIATGSLGGSREALNNALEIKANRLLSIGSLGQTSWGHRPSRTRHDGRGCGTPPREPWPEGAARVLRC